jgi:hypothetical protein
MRVGIAQSVYQRAGRPGFYSWQRQKMFLFSTASTPALGPNLPPIQLAPEAFCP